MDKQEPLPNHEDAPNVVAYRVGQLEKAVKEGFADLKQMNADLIKGVVTQKEMTEYRREQLEEHAGFNDRLGKLETESARSKEQRERFIGAVDLIKNIAAVLVGLGAVIGGLWWVVGLFHK